ncbi:MAG: hypothetical protein KAX05_02705, partial [Bacteroidales bacterium]|nr:hypothetical protein [Bacteroidales bacterium]
HVLPAPARMKEFILSGWRLCHSRPDDPVARLNDEVGQGRAGERILAGLFFSRMQFGSASCSNLPVQSAYCLLSTGDLFLLPAAANLTFTLTSALTLTLTLTLTSVSELLTINI